MVLPHPDDYEVEVNPKEERVRRFINIQIVKLQKIANVGSLILLILNFSFVAYPYVEHRDVHPYIVIPVIFVSLGLFILLLAHVYLKKLNMYRTQAEAERYFNPYQVYAIGPFEEMLYRYLWVPTLEAAINLQTDPVEKEKLIDIMEKFMGWVRLGYIPKKDFPKHLKKFYITDKQERL